MVLSTVWKSKSVPSHLLFSSLVSGVSNFSVPFSGKELKASATYLVTEGKLQLTQDSFYDINQYLYSVSSLQKAKSTRCLILSHILQRVEGLSVFFSLLSPAVLFPCHSTGSSDPAPCSPAIKVKDKSSDSSQHQ